MNGDVEFHIREKYVWSKLPANIKQILGDSEREYEKQIVSYSIRNQLRYKGNIVRVVKKVEKQYYEELLSYSREHLMLFPYHLSDVIVKGMRVTPFQYYCSIIQDLMEQERSYDSLPNFTAADCLRLLGIGRNQYIDLMNQCRSSKKFFRRKPIKELLPAKPVTVNIEPWWIIQVGYITEDDIKLVLENEKHVIDQIIDDGPLKAGDFNSKTVYSLYRKGLIYLDVPINDDDFIIVPPLEGFVMNRVLGDYFETLLYKIFVSIDEHTTVAELANILQIDLQLVKNAVSMYCRLGFARRKNQELDRSEIHPSWQNNAKSELKKYEDPLLVDWNAGLIDSTACQENNSTEQLGVEDNDMTTLTNSSCVKKIAFLFDSTLTAFLMMGNLSPGLKSHAVTMFEVGKLSDESLDSLLQELDKITEIGEGEAQRYFDHALTLRSTITFLRHNKQLLISTGSSNVALGLDLIRCESLQSLDPATCSRLMNKNYNILVSMAPLSNEIRPVTSCFPPHIGPAIPEVNSVWFKLFVYFLTKSGPPSLLLVKGTRIKKLPKMFEGYERLMVTTWGHDPGIVPTSNVLITLNDALTHSAALVQGFGLTTNGIVSHIPFPFGEKASSTKEGLQFDSSKENHWGIKLLSEKLDLKHTCGYITLLNLQSEVDCSVKNSNSVNTVADQSTASAMPVNGFNDVCSAGILAAEIDELCESVSSEEIISEKCSFPKYRENWVLLDCHFGIPLFNSELNKEICKRIVTHSLCSSDNLQALSETNRKLALQLLSFIAELQGMDPLTENIFEDSVNMSEKHLPSDLPFPVKNICFHNGKFTIWQQN